MAAMTGIEDSTSLICRAGNLLCALPIGHLIETMRPLPIEALAGAHETVMGTAVVRGAPLPVIDVARLLGELPRRPGRFVIARAGLRRVALAVAEVLGFRSLTGTRLAQLPSLLASPSAAISAIGALDGGLLVLLDAARVVPDEVFAQLALGSATT